MPLMAGFAKKEMNCYFPGLGMLGFGQAHNIVKSQATPLYARAAAFRDEKNQHFVFINLELAFATIAVKEAVTEKLKTDLPDLKLSLATIMLTSQHTHSAPGGYTHYPFYNFTVPRFQPELFSNIVSACADAAKEALQTLSASRVSWGSYEIPLDKNVAFNRSMRAYVQNPEAKTKESHEAVNREMQGLNVYDLHGKLRAHLNWFGVHATSISSHNTQIHHDNKGVAAALLERQKNIFAIFAQEAAGDVSPNFIWNKKLKRMCGPTDDQYQNATINGNIQAESAANIKDNITVDGPINCFHAYFDVSLKAAKAAHGLAFFKGTLEGPGLPSFLTPVLKFIANTSKEIRLLLNPQEHVAFFHAHGNKHVLLDNRDGTIFGIPKRWLQKLPIPANSATGELFPELRSGALETLPWVPEILPFQIVHLGNVTIVGVAGEITTVASARLKAAMSQKFPAQIIIISSYANAYMGYITTPEEYDEQCYEGGHCIYGRRTLNAFIEYFCELADNPAIKGANVFQFPPLELAKRTQVPK